LEQQHGRATEPPPELALQAVSGRQHGLVTELLPGPERLLLSELVSFQPPERRRVLGPHLVSERRLGTTRLLEMRRGPEPLPVLGKAQQRRMARRRGPERLLLLGLESSLPPGRLLEPVQRQGQGNRPRQPTARPLVMVQRLEPERQHLPLTG
jgi:hypothetical protein